MWPFKKKVKIPAVPKPGTYLSDLQVLGDRGGLKHFKPHVPATLEELQKLTDLFSKYIKWVPSEVLLTVTPDPELDENEYIRESTLRDVFNHHQFGHGAMLGEVDDDGVIYDAEIMFFNIGFLSVGELIHLIALFKPPYAQGTEEYTSGVRQLRYFWEDL